MFYLLYFQFSISAVVCSNMLAIENAKKLFSSAILAVQAERLVAASLVRESDAVYFGKYVS